MVLFSGELGWLLIEWTHLSEWLDRAEICAQTLADGYCWALILSFEKSARQDRYAHQIRLPTFQSLFRTWINVLHPSERVSLTGGDIKHILWIWIDWSQMKLPIQTQNEHAVLCIWNTLLCNHWIGEWRYPIFSALSVRWISHRWGRMKTCWIHSVAQLLTSSLGSRYS